jgi:tRNA dimethylallyltransferase
MSPKSNISPPLVVIIGETASGKSRLAIDLCRRINGEIICADSWTVRRGLDIGTDKPSAKEKELIPHYLLDIIDPCDDFTAAVYKKLANQAIDKISSRGKIAVMVGGSGLYIDSVIYNFGFLSPGDPNMRQELNKLSIHELLDKTYELKIPIPKDIDRSNKRRLIRLIESGGVSPKKGSLRDNTLVIGVKVDPDELKTSIEKRVNMMIEKGLENEVRTLSEQYRWDCEALKGVGYKQWQRYFEGSQTLEETRQQIISATNNLAKKQRTWFKRNKSIHWYKQPIKIDEIVDLVTTGLTI